MAAKPLPVYPTDHEFYEALLRRDERAYHVLYASTYPSFRHWVLNNQGTEMDAEDAFQKGLLNFMLNLETGKYQLQAEARITTVTFDYCKRVWLTELKSARLRHRGAMPEHLTLIDTSDVEKDLERMDTVSAVQHSLNQLKDTCRKLLEWFYMDELPLREIAERLGMKEESVKSKRYQCAEKLKAFFQKTTNH